MADEDIPGIEELKQDPEAYEVAKLDAAEDVPPKVELPRGQELIAGIIASVNGGVNGLNPYVALTVTDNGDGTLDYTLTDRDGGDTATWLVTITPGVASAPVEG